MGRMGLSMTKPDLMFKWAVANSNNEYTRHGTAKPKWKKLKNITPTKEEAEKSLEYLDKEIKKIEEIL